MTENTPPDRDADDLGLTSEQWQDLLFAYNYDGIDPAPGTVEAEVFGPVAATTRPPGVPLPQTRAAGRGTAPPCGTAEPEPEPELEATI
jgi:hypothetical protein